MSDMETVAVVMEGPEHLSVRRLALNPLTAADVVVDIDWSGISTGTERLLWTGRMPPFPGMGYPLVPGYESVGRVVDAGHEAKTRIGDQVFVPGSNCFKHARGLFGGAARRLIVPGARAFPINHRVKEQGVLIALAATAQHAIANGNAMDQVAPPQLIVGHGVLGRLLARLTMAAGFAPPTVWETSQARRSGAKGYNVLHPDEDPRRDYAVIVDVSGDNAILDLLVPRLARGGEIVLAGFYDRLSFAFPPSFMKEARFRVAAEWKQEDLTATLAAINDGRLSLDDLITHRRDAADADQAYRTAFGDASCLKMVLDWRGCS